MRLAPKHTTATAGGFNVMDYRDITVSPQQYLCQHHHERSLFLRVHFVHLNLTNEVSFLKNILQAVWKHGPIM